MVRIPEDYEIQTHPNMKGRFRRLEGGALVAEGVVLVGDLRLAADANLWFGTVLRGDDEPIEVGEATNIQDGCVVHVDIGHPTRIGKRVSIGHKAMIHGCTIEDSCLIGMGAILLTGCRIGERSIVGAGALVPEGVVIPPRSLVLGMPGKVRREIRPEEAEDQDRRARHYVERARSYL